MSYSFRISIHLQKVKSFFFPDIRVAAHAKTVQKPGGHLSKRVTGRGRHFLSPILDVFVRFRSYVLKCVSTQGLIFKFLFILCHNLFHISTLGSLK